MTAEILANQDGAGQAIRLMRSPGSFCLIPGRRHGLGVPACSIGLRLRMLSSPLSPPPLQPHLPPLPSNSTPALRAAPIPQRGFAPMAVVQAVPDLSQKQAAQEPVFMASSFAALLSSILDEIRSLKRLGKEYLELVRLRRKEEEKEFLSVAEAAKICGRSTDTIRRWIRKGRLKARKPSPDVDQGQYLIRRKDLQEL